MTADHRIDDHLRAADPVAEDEAGRWVDSPEGREAFDDVVRMATLADAEQASHGSSRRRRVWPRRLALAGVTAVALVAAGLSLWSVREANRGDDLVVSPDARGFSVMHGGGVDSGSGPPGTAGPVGPDAVQSGGGSSERRVIEEGGGSVDADAPVDATAGAGPAGGAATTARAREPALGRGPEAEIVKTARMEIAVGDQGLDRSRSEVRDTVDRAGGFIESSERSPRSATLTVRIPVARFEAVLDRFEDLGEVRQQSVSGEDVSAELVDLEARLRHWQAQEAVLLELMEQATSVSESIEVRRELVPVQETIERLEGRLRVLEDDVEFSTVNLFLVDPEVDLPEAPDTDDPTWFADTWNEATRLGSGVVRGTLVALGALLPIAALWVAPVAGLVWLSRRRRGAGVHQEGSASGR